MGVTSLVCYHENAVIDAFALDIGIQQPNGKCLYVMSSFWHHHNLLHTSLWIILQWYQHAWETYLVELVSQNMYSNICIRKSPTLGVIDTNFVCFLLLTGQSLIKSISEIKMNRSTAGKDDITYPLHPSLCKNPITTTCCSYLFISELSA